MNGRSRGVHKTEGKEQGSETLNESKEGEDGRCKGAAERDEGRAIGSQGSRGQGSEVVVNHGMGSQDGDYEVQ